ncbi:hypothetical protein STA3757_09180 [Stanieria sp. NIES-3757]|nr:hypothetical protein STA3757_09180 [Stanieria sp. NIES-3757]
MFIPNEQPVNGKKKIIVCLGRACRKYHSQSVWDAFKSNLDSEVELIPISCLGQCGNGPMVLVEPEQIWYWQVSPDEVPLIIKQHLQQQHPIKDMLYPKFHKKH